MHSHTFMWTPISMYTHTYTYVCIVHTYTYVHIFIFTSENKSADACTALIQLEFCVHAYAHVKKGGWIYYKSALSMQTESEPCELVTCKLEHWESQWCSSKTWVPGIQWGYRSVNLWNLQTGVVYSRGCWYQSRVKAWDPEALMRRTDGCPHWSRWEFIFWGIFWVLRGKMMSTHMWESILLTLGLQHKCHPRPGKSAKLDQN